MFRVYNLFRTVDILNLKFYRL